MPFYDLTRCRATSSVLETRAISVIHSPSACREIDTFRQPEISQAQFRCLLTACATAAEASMIVPLGISAAERFALRIIAAHINH